MLVNLYGWDEKNYSYWSFSGGRGLVTGKAVMRLASLAQETMGATRGNSLRAYLK